MNARTLLPAVALLAIAASAAFLLSGHLTSQAVQNPTIALDMVTTGTTYDDTTNTMTVGQIESSSTGSQSVSHTHAAHLVINNVRGPDRLANAAQLHRRPHAGPKPECCPVHR